jgi:hypothetical protein
MSVSDGPLNKAPRLEQITVGETAAINFPVSDRLVHAFLADPKEMAATIEKFNLASADSLLGTAKNSGGTAIRGFAEGPQLAKTGTKMNWDVPHLFNDTRTARTS